MRIGLVIHELCQQGGTERQLLSLARALLAAGHEVGVYCSAADPARCYPELLRGLDVVEAGRGPLRRGPLAGRRVGDMLRLASVLPGDLDVLNPHHWPPHWAALWARRGTAIPVVCMLNDVPDLAARTRAATVPPLRRLLYRLYHRADRLAMRWVDRVVVLNEGSRELLRREYGLEAVVIRSGVDHERFGGAVDPAPLRARLGVPPGACVVGFLGILMPHRRLEDLVEAVALARAAGVELRAVIAGSPAAHPDYAAALCRRVAARGLQGVVQLRPAVPEAELAVFYRACDVFAFPSEEQTWGIVVTEAMAAGRPVVVSRGAGVHEVLGDGETALLVPPRDPAALAAALAALARDPALRLRLGEAGRAHARRRFSWERYAADMLAVFEEAILGRRSRALPCPLPAMAGPP